MTRNGILQHQLLVVEGYNKGNKDFLSTRKMCFYIIYIHIGFLME